MNLENLVRVLPGLGVEKITDTVNWLANKANGVTTGIVIKVSGQCLQQDSSMSIEKTAGSLVFLQEIAGECHLWPLVITGAGTDIDKALEEAGLPNKKVRGLRYTDDGVYPIIAATMQKKADELAELVNCYGGKASAVPMHSGLFVPKTLKQPLIIATSLGTDQSGRGYNINADDAAAVAVKALNPKAYLNVMPTGGILEDVHDSSTLVKRITVEEAKQLSSDGMAVKIESAADVLKQLPRLLVVVTSPENMIYSLFGNGYGTVITGKTVR